MDTETRLVNNFENLNASKTAGEILVAKMEIDIKKADLLKVTGKEKEALEILAGYDMKAIMNEFRNFKDELLAYLNEDGKKDITQFIRKVGN